MTSFDHMPLADKASAPEKPRIVYVNGRFCAIEEASIPIMDRGFLFADGIYEVTAIIDGAFVDNHPHLARLDRSLKEINIANPHPLAEWIGLQEKLVAANALREGLVYIQVTRGVYERDFTCPPDLPPSVVMFTQPKQILDSPAARTGIAVISVPDLRWVRRDIKSVALLPQVLAKFAAKAAGVAEAWMVQDGFVTEGASSTAFIVTEAREIVTRPLSTDILPGITRASVLALAQKHGLTLVERPFSLEEAYEAREAFLTSASSFAMPIVKIDDHFISNGAPGPVAQELRALYIAAARANAAAKGPGG